MTQSLFAVLVGNPNCGKTAVFNALTGSRQRVGNWPGVTVEKKSGIFEHQQTGVKVVDLPGIYSTNVSSDSGAIDEQITCQYLLSGKADLIVNVLDASNLERNLYLTLQLLEMKIPMILAVNMMDVVKRRGFALQVAQLSEMLDCPVVELVARRKQGIQELKKVMVQTRKISQFKLPIPDVLEKSIQRLNQSPWFAMRLLEKDYLAARHVDENTLAAVAYESHLIEEKLKKEPDVILATARYQVIRNLISAVVIRKPTTKKTITQWIDRLVLHRFLGIPIFLGVMYLMFLFAINIGGAFQDFFDISSATIFVDGLARVLSYCHFPAWLTAVLANGVGKGINTTITFIPVIGGMFLFLAFLEDSGYMARAAFVMDRLMYALGLPGKAFVPMIVGFGCNVPAVMGARTLENRRDRVLTVMMMPFMSCGARLAIFAVFASAFFHRGGALIIFALYLVGILIAILTGLVLRKTVLPGKPAPLVMELPPYHLPRWTALWRHMWHRLKNFLTRASRVIIPVCIILGVLNSINLHGKLTTENNQSSLLASVGRVITPVFAPMGIQQNNWPATVGLTTGILAKEVVVGTLNTLYSQQSNVVQQAATFDFKQSLKDAVISIPKNLAGLGDAFKNPITASEAPHDMGQAAYGVMSSAFAGKIGAFAYLLFVLLYFPCVSTMAAMRREIGGHWALFSVLWSTGLAYALSVMTYQAATAAVHPIGSFLWVSGLLIALTLAVLALRRYAGQGGPSLINIPVVSESACAKPPVDCGSSCRMCHLKR